MKIAFAGVGNMGGGMAVNLVEAQAWLERLDGGKEGESNL